MCLTDAIEEMIRLAVEAELIRITPERGCRMCRADEPCFWHRQPLNPAQPEDLT